jgi:hypothetical protein
MLHINSSELLDGERFSGFLKNLKIAEGGEQ